MRLIITGAIAGASLLGLGGYVAAVSSAALEAEIEVHPTALATPWPSDDADPADAARRRGERLARIRLGCHDCHGADLGGTHEVDGRPVVGRLYGTNLTLGHGGRDDDYAVEDLERLLRHGVGRDGRASLMPVVDYAHLSDREVSDLFVYLTTLPPVDREVPAPQPTLGLRLRAALGSPLDAHRLDHGRPHPVLPPDPDDGLAFGEHLARSCRSCHGLDYAGGPVPGGDPSWPPATNLTPHPRGLGDWTVEDLRIALRLGRSRDGRALHPAMPWQRLGGLSDEEISALWAFLRSLPPREG